MGTTAYLGRLSRRGVTAVALVLIGLVAIADYLTGPDIAVSILYLVPVSLGAWYAGYRTGILLSVTSAVFWFVADITTRTSYPHWVVPYWNAVVAIGFFLVVTRILSELHASRARQEELAQFVIHDLRSPLTNVLLGLETLHDVGAESCDETSRAIITMAISSGKRMQALIDSLLDLSRLEDGQMPLHPDRMPVEELIRSSLEQVALWAGQNRVALAQETAEAPLAVHADRSLSQRVLVNLLANALKFSPAGSKITVRAAAAEPGLVAFRVMDQGPGIPSQWQDKVFDKFAQMQARKAGVSVGSGLGLAFCRLAVRAQGGRIWIEGEPGRGTTVAFTLPRA